MANSLLRYREFPKMQLLLTNEVRHQLLHDLETFVRGNGDASFVFIVKVGNNVKFVVRGFNTSTSPRRVVKGVPEFDLLYVQSMLTFFQYVKLF